MHLLVRNGPALPIHGPAHRDGGPGPIEPVSHRPRCKCHGLGRAGPSRGLFSASLMGLVGARPILRKIDGPGRAAGHYMHKDDGATHQRRQVADPARPNSGPAHQRRPMTSAENFDVLDEYCPAVKMRFFVPVAKCWVCSMETLEGGSNIFVQDNRRFLALREEN